MEAFIGRGEFIGISGASIAYVVAYLFGMKRKYADKEEFIRVLDANLEFLKLSFVPLVFLITVVGFIFTFMGTFVGTEKSAELLGTFIKYCNEVNISDLFKLPNIQDVSIVSVVDSIFLFIQISIMFYVCSIPLQLFTYYIILVIKYFFQFGKPYKDILRVWWEKVKESIIT